MGTVGLKGNAEPGHFYWRDEGRATIWALARPQAHCMLYLDHALVCSVLPLHTMSDHRGLKVYKCMLYTYSIMVKFISRSSISNCSARPKI